MKKWLLLKVVSLIACLPLSASSLSEWVDPRSLATPQEVEIIPKNDVLYPVVEVCSACHGVDEAAKNNPSIPIIAAQYPRYLYQQIRAFAEGDSGLRPNALMEAIAQSLSEDEKQAISQYYAGLQKLWLDAPSQPNFTKGRRIYLGGVFDKTIPACSSCHSPTGFGNEPANYPALAGQHAEYLVDQIQKYRAKTRVHTIMNSVAEKLNDEEIEAVAYYLQGLRSKSI
jgi:cytochrome c553